MSLKVLNSGKLATVFVETITMNFGQDIQYIESGFTQLTTGSARFIVSDFESIVHVTRKLGLQKACHEQSLKHFSISMFSLCVRQWKSQPRGTSALRALRILK
jgi:hypothetical protein